MPPDTPSPLLGQSEQSDPRVGEVWQGSEARYRIVKIEGEGEYATAYGEPVDGVGEGVEGQLGAWRRAGWFPVEADDAS